MKIEVARTHNESGHLVFTITAQEPNVNPFSLEDRMVLDHLDQLVRDVQKSLNPKSELYEDTMLSMHSIKEKMLVRVINKLKSSIHNDLRSQFEPMCNEIFNWIYENQNEPVGSWLSQFSPQREKYYFSNDPQSMVIHSDTDFEIDEDEDED